MIANSTQLEPRQDVWRSNQVYILAGICLALGLGIGYLLRGSQSHPQAVAAAPSTPASKSQGTMSQMPSLDDMKHMADKKAEPLLAQLKTDPNNAGLLAQVGKTYEAAHQFKDAASYFEKALVIDEKNTAARAEMASCLYYSGDVDGAIAQLERSLTYDSTNANSLFNLGVIRWQGKKDANGAMGAWRRLLSSNPGLPAEKKDQVKKLIAEAEQQNKTN